MADWLTNSPASAEALHKADARYNAAREAALNLPLAQKVEAYRQAKADREEAYRLVRAGPDNRPAYATSWPVDMGA